MGRASPGIELNLISFLMSVRSICERRDHDSFWMCSSDVSHFFGVGVISDTEGIQCPKLDGSHLEFWRYGAPGLSGSYELEVDSRSVKRSGDAISGDVVGRHARMAGRGVCQINIRKKDEVLPRRRCVRLHS